MRAGANASLLSVFTPPAPTTSRFKSDALNIVEIDTDERIAAVVMFDVDDIDAAFAELDARYLAGEAAGHAHTWSLVAGVYAAINRHELPATTPDWVNIDHRRGTAVAPGDAIAYIRASLEGSTGGLYVEAVHRLSNLGSGRHPRGAWDLARRASTPSGAGSTFSRSKAT